MATGDLRSLLLLAHSLAHDLSEDALEVERRLGPRRHDGLEIAEAGISTLAHLACAASALPAHDLPTRRRLRDALLRARDSLESFRSMVRPLDGDPLVSPNLTRRIIRSADELIALLRALLAEADRACGLSVA
jgi:hypothetical protein